MSPSVLQTLVVVMALTFLNAACATGEDDPITSAQVKQETPVSQTQSANRSTQIATQTPTPKDAKRSRLTGIDISRYQVVADWLDVKKAGIDFVFVKATEGVDFVDPSFERDWAALKEHGFVRGAYHFYRPEDDPVQQATHFTSTVKLEPTDLPPVVDIEVLDKTNPAELSKNLLIWIETVAQKCGKTPIIYTGNSFWNRYETDGFGNYPLWVAEYGVDEPRIPNGWKEWHFWQYQQKGTIQGIKGDVDHNYFNGHLETLQEFLDETARKSKSRK